MAGSVRFSSLNEYAFSETEQDANSAVTELEKGLRSTEIGEQCEAIIRISKVYEKYPFPVLINSSILKLADSFRVGNNFIRLWIVKVCQQSEKHIEKIISVDEFINRIFFVIHSNDPIARSLTLRLFGSIASIIPERQQVHHSIRSCLDSHSIVEVEAAIYAAEKFAAKSKTFAVSMCNKISDMIYGLTTPVHMKLQLIPILRHMHHDTDTALMVRTVCIELLTKYPAQDFVIVTLKTLTHLAGAMPVGIPDQVSLLVSYVTAESRRDIRVSALCCLSELAKQGSHYWPLDCILRLIDIAGDSTDEELTGYIVDIMIILTKSSAICHTYYRPDSALMSLCYNISLSSNPVLAGKAVEVITQIACYCYREGLSEHSDESIDGIESYLLFLMCSTDDRNIDNHILKSALSNAIAVCTVQPKLCDRFVHLIASRLLQNTSKPSLEFCKALCSLCPLKPNILYTFLPNVYMYLREISSSTTLKFPEIQGSLCAVIFQCSSACMDEEPEDMKTTIDALVRNTDFWTNYKIMRSAARYGQFAAYYRIVSHLREHIASECTYFWFMGLQEISVAECNINTKDSRRMLQNINKAVNSYCKATASLKAAGSPAFSLSFQVEYTRIRTEMLHCFASLFATCNFYCLSPPAAIATAVTQSTRDDLNRYGQISVQLRKRAKEFRYCSDLYWKLYQMAFDADSTSLKNIQVLQFICTYMAYCIECITSSTPQPDELVLDTELENGPLEIQLMIKNYKKAAFMKVSTNLPPKSITHKHVYYIKKQAEVLVSSRLCIPRYFFQTLQGTSVTLSVMPQPRISSECVSIISGSELTVKVEGVLTHKTRTDSVKTATAVVLTVTSVITVKATVPHDTKVSGETTTVLSQTVIPQREFFQAEFLFAYTVLGQYQINVDAAIEDETGFIWQTGTRSTLQIKVIEDVNFPKVVTK